MHHRYHLKVRQRRYVQNELSVFLFCSVPEIIRYPFLVTFVMGIVLSLEQNKTETQTIRSVRISAAGPLGGIGDALFWLTLVPITAGLTANIAMEGNILGAVLFLVIFNAVQFIVRWWLMHWSYNLGTKAVTMLTSNAKEFTRAASILGIFVVGGLIANYGATSLRITVGSPTIKIGRAHV